MEFVPKIVQLHDLASAYLRNLVDLQDVSLQTVFLDLDPFDPKFQCIVLRRGALHQQYYTLEKQTQVSLPLYL